MPPSERHTGSASRGSRSRDGHDLDELSRFAAMMAHEIRNPLATILSAISQIRRHGNPVGDTATLLQIAEEEAFRLNRMVTEVLEFAQMRKASLAPGRPHALAVDVVRGMTERAGMTENVTVSVAPGGEDIECLFDRDLLARALECVLANAMHAVSPAGGRIEVRIRRVPGDGGEAALEVEDDGCGIPEEVRGRIFNPFFSSKASGVGLGLPLVQRIAREHGGTVTVEPAPVRGTIVRVALRAASEEGRALDAPRRKKREVSK